MGLVAHLLETPHTSRAAHVARVRPISIYLFLLKRSAADPLRNPYRTQLPLTVIKEHRGILGPLLLATLGWQSRPPCVTFGLECHVARMLLSVWEGNIDWSCPGDGRRGTLNFLDPAQGEDELYTWTDSDGQSWCVLAVHGVP